MTHPARGLALALLLIGCAAHGPSASPALTLNRLAADVLWVPPDAVPGQIPTSFDVGWAGHCACIIATDAAGHVIPRERWYEWHGEWENSRGEVVYYGLGGSGHQLNGYGAFLSRRDAERLRRRIDGDPRRGRPADSRLRRAP